MGRGISQEFPNPERKGCPPQDVLKNIAAHRMPLAKAGKVLDHITSCSPGYEDISRLRDAGRLGRVRTLVAVAACILFVALAALWAYLHNHSQARLARTAVLDLRDRSMTRGTSQDEPLELSRDAGVLKIYLPSGSEARIYEARIVKASGEAVLSRTALATTQGGARFLQVTASLSLFPPGQYLLEIREPAADWNSYQLVLK